MNFIVLTFVLLRLSNINATDFWSVINVKRVPRPARRCFHFLSASMIAVASSSAAGWCTVAHSHSVTVTWKRPPWFKVFDIANSEVSHSATNGCVSSTACSVVLPMQRCNNRKSVKHSSSRGNVVTVLCLAGLPEKQRIHLRRTPIHPSSVEALSCLLAVAVRASTSRILD